MISVFGQDMQGFLRLARRAEQLVQREHRIIGRMIGIVAGRAVLDLPVFLHREIVGNGNRLVVSHQEAVLRTRRRAPGPHARVGSGLLEKDRRLAALLVLAGVLGHPLFMRTPAKLGGLEPLGQETLDRPGVPERPHRLGLAGALGVALGDMHTLHADLLHELCPALARGRLLEPGAGVTGDVHERLLHEP